MVNFKTRSEFIKLTCRKSCKADGNCSSIIPKSFENLVRMLPIFKRMFLFNVRSLVFVIKKKKITELLPALVSLKKLIVALVTDLNIWSCKFKEAFMQAQ